MYNYFKKCYKIYKPYRQKIILYIMIYFSLLEYTEVINPKW